MSHFNIITALFKLLLILRFQPNLVSTRSVDDSLQSINITRSDNLDSSDKVSLLVVNATFCQDQNSVDIALSAECYVVSQKKDDSGSDFCNVECVCNNQTGSFIVHEKQCRDERKLRQGKQRSTKFVGLTEYGSPAYMFLYHTVSLELLMTHVFRLQDENEPDQYPILTYRLHVYLLSFYKSHCLFTACRQIVTHLLTSNH